MKLLGDGRSVSFWNDKWLGDSALFEMRDIHVPSDLKDATVAIGGVRGFGVTTFNHASIKC